VDEGLQAIVTLVEQGGIAVLALTLWYLERQRALRLEMRIEELHGKLDDCLSGKVADPELAQK